MIRRLRLKENYLYDMANSGSTKLIKVVDAYATFPDSERYSADEDYTNVLDRYYSTITDLAFDVGEKTPFSSDIKDYYADPNEPGNIIVLNSEDYVGILTIKIEVLKYCEPTLNDIRSFNIRTYSESLIRKESYERKLRINKAESDYRGSSATNGLRAEKKKRSIRESYEGSHTFGYIEPDGEFYQDIFGEFTVEKYYDEESDEVLGWTWYCSDDFEPTEPYFSTAKEAYEDAKYVLTPDDGSELVIDE